MKALKEWESHVIKNLDEPIAKSWCGVALGGASFGLQGAEHARLCVEKETRVQPCPDCWREIQEATA